jgi:hypothetical protein
MRITTTYTYSSCVTTCLIFLAHQFFLPLATRVAYTKLLFTKDKSPGPRNYGSIDRRHSRVQGRGIVGEPRPALADKCVQNVVGCREQPGQESTTRGSVEQGRIRGLQKSSGIRKTIIPNIRTNDRSRKNTLIPQFTKHLTDEQQRAFSNHLDS